MSLTDLAPELTDSIVDFLHDDPSSLKALSTSCRRFLPACRFHLFNELSLESENLRGKIFPASLTPLVKRIRLSPGAPATTGFTAFPLFPFGSFAIPPPRLSGPQLRECINNIRSPHVTFNGVKTSTDHALFTAVATSDLKHSATSLSLNCCSVDSEDLVTLCYALPRVEALHISALTFDNSRAMIRKVERAAPAPIGFFVPPATPTSDWSSFLESMASTVKSQRLHLKEIVVEGTKWSSELCESLVALVERVDESTKLTLRVQLPAVPVGTFEAVHDENPAAQDPIGEHLEFFARFLEICGAKIDRLDVCLGNAAACHLALAVPNKLPLPRVQSGGGIDTDHVNLGVDSGFGLPMNTSLDSVLEYCPRLETLRLSGSLCSAEIMKQVIQSVGSAHGNPPALRVLGLGPVGEGVLWADISHLLGFAAAAGLERVVIAVDDTRVTTADDRCLALEKFAGLRNKGLDVVFAEHRQVGYLL